MDKNNYSVCIIGLGYIGLPTAALLANKGFKVHGVDIDESVVKTINQGNIHIVEPNLDQYVRKAIDNGYLVADTKPMNADVFIIAVPTPFHEGYVPNINYIIEATESIAPYIEEDNIIILESTSPVGTTEKIEQILKKKGINTSKLHIAHCPERVLPGNIMSEITENDRIVGGLNKEATDKVVNFYKNFVTGKILTTDSKTAEMAKLTENSFRDVNIAFANELSILCDELNINTQELINLANKHPRVEILNPGPGVGGHCIAVDPWFIIHNDNQQAKIIKSAREVNMEKENWTYKKIISSIKPGSNNITIYGLAFKPNVDDIRESPALNIASRLDKTGDYDIRVVEPFLDFDKLRKMNFKPVNLENGSKRNGIHVILVNHDIFKVKLPGLLKNKLVIDTVGMLEK